MHTQAKQGEVLFGAVFTHRRLRLMQLALLHQLVDADDDARREIQAWVRELEELEARVA